LLLGHVVPASRLTRSYFRRWWFWKGISHARLHRLHDRTELGIDLRQVPTILGVPRYVFGNVVRDGAKWLGGWLARDPVARTEAWMAIVYYAGYCKALWDARRRQEDAGRRDAGRLGAPAART
jgi:hypothetical protein